MTMKLTVQPALEGGYVVEQTHPPAILAIFQNAEDAFAFMRRRLEAEEVRARGERVFVVTRTQDPIVLRDTWDETECVINWKARTVEWRSVERNGEKG